MWTPPARSSSPAASEVLAARRRVESYVVILRLADGLDLGASGTLTMAGVTASGNGALNFNLSYASLVQTLACPLP